MVVRGLVLACFSNTAQEAQNEMFGVLFKEDFLTKHHSDLPLVKHFLHYFLFYLSFFVLNGVSFLCHSKSHQKPMLYSCSKGPRCPNSIIMNVYWMVNHRLDKTHKKETVMISLIKTCALVPLIPVITWNPVICTFCVGEFLKNCANQWSNCQEKYQRRVMKVEFVNPTKGRWWITSSKL